MAWRIQDQIVDGEIDNRQRDRITGWLRMTDGRHLRIHLIGNCASDIAGSLIHFRNPAPIPGDIEGLSEDQRGQAGEMTASRKVREPAVPPDVIQQMSEAERPFACRWTNSLYLEWYTSENGRVVVESSSFLVELVDGPVWREASDESTDSLAEPFAFLAYKEVFEEETEDDGTEEEAFEGTEEDLPSPDPLPERDAEKLAAFIEKMNAGNERTRNWRWIGRTHPLIAECLKLAKELARHCRPPPNVSHEHPFCELVESAYAASRKLAVVLGPRSKAEWPPDLVQAPLVLVFLNQANVCLEDGLRALESIEEEGLLSAEWCERVESRLRDLQRETTRLIEEARSSL